MKLCFTVIRTDCAKEVKNKVFFIVLIARSSIQNGNKISIIAINANNAIIY
jgi:hypothetical protein